MSQIEVVQLKKAFRIADRQPGIAGAVKGLFHRKHKTVQALSDISFSLEEGELLA